MPDPISQIANAAMHAFADLVAQAGPTSRFVRGRDELGERWLDVAVQALRAETKRALTGRDLEATIAELDGPLGEAAAWTMVLGIAQGAIDAVAAEARS